jgi:predicted DNA-binding transcriptional regulator AlpA
MNEDAMAKLSEKTPALTTLPDFAVLSTAQTCAALDISLDTLIRITKSGEGPRRVRLSPGRYGYVVSEIRDWLKRRMEGAA